MREQVRGELQPSRLEFISYEPLAAGAEYLLFLSPSLEDVPPGSEINVPEHARSAAYKNCVARLPEAKWTSNFAFRFHESFRDLDGKKVWLEKDFRSPLIPEDVRTMKIKCEAEVALGCESIGEPVLVDWISLKDALTGM